MFARFSNVIPQVMETEGDAFQNQNNQLEVEFTRNVIYKW